MPRTAVIFSFAVFLLFLFVSPVLAEGTGTLTVSLQDSFGNYIYQGGSCLDEPCVAYNNLELFVKDSNGKNVVVQQYPSSSNRFNLSSGTYTVRLEYEIGGPDNSNAPNRFVVQESQVIIFEGQNTISNIVLKGGYLTVLLENSFTPWDHSPSNNLQLQIKDLNGQYVVLKTYSNKKHYLPPGTYTINMGSICGTNVNPFQVTIAEGQDIVSVAAIKFSFLTLRLKDSYGNSIYDGVKSSDWLCGRRECWQDSDGKGSCLGEQCIPWRDIDIEISNNQYFYAKYAASSTDTFPLCPGTYNVEISGQQPLNDLTVSPYYNSYYNNAVYYEKGVIRPVTKETTSIRVSEGETTDLTMAFMGGFLNLLLKDNFENFVYDTQGDCSYNSCLRWYDFKLQIRNSTGFPIYNNNGPISAINSLYLSPGDYIINVTGKKRYSDESWITKEIQTTIYDGQNTSSVVMFDGDENYLDVSIKDPLENFIYDKSGFCRHDSCIPWYDIRLQISDLKNHFLYDSNSSSSSKLYLEPGTYKISAKGKKEETSPWAMDIGIINITKGVKTYLYLTLGVPDLTPTSIELSNPNPKIGENLTINTTIKNIGDGDAWDLVALFFSRDLKTSNSTLIGYKIINFIPAFGDAIAQINWTSTNFDEIYVNVSLHDDHVRYLLRESITVCPYGSNCEPRVELRSISESNYENNFISTTSNIGNPDLTPISLGYSNPIVGNPTEVGAIIANIGDADAKDVAVEFYVDNIWKETGFVDILANSQQKLTFNWIPEKNGTHNITIKVDPFGKIVEVDEENNEVEFSVDVLDNSDIPPIPIFGPENFYATNKITTYKLLSSRCIPNLGGKNCDWNPEEYIFSVPPGSSLLQVHASVLKLNPLAWEREIKENVRSSFLLREPTGKLTFPTVSEQLEYEQDFNITDPTPGEWKFIPLKIEGKNSDTIEASIRTYSKKTQDDKNLKLSIPVDKIFVTNQFNNYGSFLWSGHVDILVPDELKDSGEIIVDIKGYVDNQKEQNVWGDMGTIDLNRKVRTRADVWIGSQGVLIGKPESVGYGGVDAAVNMFRSISNFFSGEFPGKLEEIPKTPIKVFVDALFSGWDILKTIVETPVSDTSGSHAFGELNGLWSNHNYTFPIFANEAGTHDIYILSILEPSDINLWGSYDSSSGQFIGAKDKRKMLISLNDEIKVSSEPEKFIFKMLSDMSLKMEGLIMQITTSQNKILSTSLPVGMYNITASDINNSLSVKFYDANITENITDFIELDNVLAVSQNLNLPSKHEFTNVYSVDMPLNFSYATLVINYTEPTTIKETDLRPYKCNSTYYNYSARTCENGKWIEILSQFYTQNITENTFTINLTSFSGFAIGGRIPDPPQYSPSSGGGGSSYDDAVFLKNTTTTTPSTTTTMTNAVEITTTTLPAEKNVDTPNTAGSIDGPTGLFAFTSSSTLLTYLAAGIFATGAVVYVGMKNKKLLLNYSFKGDKKKLSKNRKRMR